MGKCFRNINIFILSYTVWSKKSGTILKIHIWFLFFFLNLDDLNAKLNK